MNRNRIVLVNLLVLSCGLFALGQTAARQATPFDPNKDARTGVEIGRPIPPFQLTDQFGRRQDFNSIKGPQGAVLIFFRSADW